MAGPKIVVQVTGDTRGLNRSLNQASSQLSIFGMKTERSMKGVKMAMTDAVGGGTVTAGAAAAAVGFKMVLDAAREAQVVLGQTRAAVQQAGVSWEENGRRIEQAADSISRAASLDDEDVLRSFQVFVRGQGDVQKALDLTALAADVARGRYISLEAASAIVNKAALGNAGALRRVGIQVDKNATSVELLALLQQKYAGSAAAYSSSASGSIDRLTKSFEDAKEMIGTALLPVVSHMADQLEIAVSAASKLGSALASVGNVSLGPLGKVKDVLVDIAKYTGPQAALFGGIAAYNALFGGGGASGVSGATPDPSGGLSGLMPGSTVDPVTGRVTPGKSSAPASIFDSAKLPMTNLPVGFQNALLKAQNEKDRGGLLESLKRNRAFFETQLQRAIDAGDSKAVNEIRESLLGTQNAIKGVYAEMNAEAQAARDKVRDAAERAKADARAAAVERGEQLASALEDMGSIVGGAIKAAANVVEGLSGRLKKQADEFKSEALDRLDAKQNNLDTSRAIVDAKEALRRARLTGGKFTIMEARRGLEDANLDRQRYLLGRSTVSSAAGGGFNISGATFHFHGVQNVDQLLAQLQKLSKSGSGQTRGKLMSGGVYGIG